MITLSLVLGVTVFAAADADQAAFFEKEIRPIFAAHCTACHGPEKQKSDLRLDTADGFFKGGSRGPLTVKDEPASLLLDVISYTGDVQMPPAGKLDQADIDKLTVWVNAGAFWPDHDPVESDPAADKTAAFAARKQTHWAYQPLSDSPPPSVSDATWPRNVIDRYILASLEKAGLHPAPQADKRTLIRRITFDLIGLPPSVEEVNAFLADESPDAFMKVVDRLLASPQYGERWARHWLDVVRYTDSFDSRASTVTDPAEIWRYRDWVVQSLNNDMPYDQFLQYQIAGDLIPAPNGRYNRDGLIATGVLAIGNWPQGDADKEKMVTDIVDDQIDLVTRGFLGVTMSCARCHDHKFDPFTTEEYYGLAGIFFSSSILPGPGAKTEGSPILHLPIASQEDLAARKAREDRTASLRGELEALLQEERTQWARAEAAKTEQYLLATANPQADTTGLNGEALQRWTRYLNQGVHPALQTVDRDIQGIPGFFARHGAVDLPSSVANTGADEIRYLTITQPAHTLAVHPSPDQGVGAVWNSPVDGHVLVEGTIADADGTCGDGVKWTLGVRANSVQSTLIEMKLPNGGNTPIAHGDAIAVRKGDQLILTVLPDQGHACDTTLIDWRITSDTGETWDFVNDVLPRYAEGNPWPDASGRQNVWWLHSGEAGPRADGILFAPWYTAKAEVDAGRRGPEALQQAAAMVQSALDDAAPGTPLAPALEAIIGAEGPYWIAPQAPAPGSRREAVATELADLDANPLPPLEYAVGIQEGGVPNTPTAGIQDTRVHRRGDYNNLGDVVPRAMPAVIATAETRSITGGSGRADLARWITEDCAPLTARVMVNRIWQHHFGEGIVRTPGDFGKQGQPPTHPDLLDYLAKQFIDSGWSIKSLHRTILASAAYRQASTTDAAIMEQDPDNLLWTRMKRQRLDAETLRDSLLFVSGRLDLTPGGPAYTDLATPRRTLYLRTVRSNLSTYTMLFDGADPTAVVPKRTESLVAPQALFLMNNPFITEETDTLAKTVAPESGDLPRLIDALYQRLYARPAGADEIDIGSRFLADLGYPNEEALAAYAQVLVSANEFIFVD